MIFSSSIFLFLFLPFFLGLYYLVSNKFKNLVLLFSSLVFYTWGEEKIVLILIASVIIDFSCGLIIEKGLRKTGLTISIISNLLFLGFFKYFNFTFENFNALLNFFQIQSETLKNIPIIALPIGVSFYTFQTMSYTIDVYRGKVKANKNILEFATFVTMFPQLVAGPIVRYADIQSQLKRKNISTENFSIGIERFIIGLAKKMLIANTFASVADDVFSHEITDLSSFYAWIGIIAYSFQIYFDFSGYSDMAIGLGKMFGFDFLENFNYPYISKSIREFWRRWHISLSTWFRDYVYISLGGNRVSKARTYLNLLIVFFVTGLWHGASWNFVIWGLFHGTFLALERSGFDKRLKTLWAPLQHLYTLLIVVIGWVFFRSENIQNAVSYLKKMFLFSKGDPTLSSYLDFFHLNREILFFALLAILFSTPFFGKIERFMINSKIMFLRPIGLIVLFLLSIIYVGADSYNPFIYFRF